MIMCKYIKDIFFPFNIFGKKKQCVTFDPYHEGNGTFPQYIEWTGERIDVSWLDIIVDRATRKTTRTPKRFTFTDADEREDGVMIDYENSVRYLRNTEDGVHINCTNVTFLMVNGTILIDEE